MTPYDELAYILRRFDMPIASMQKSVLWDDAVAALEYVIDNRRTTSAPMTPDQQTAADNALVRILEQHGTQDAVAAAERIKSLQAEVERLYDLAKANNALARHEAAGRREAEVDRQRMRDAIEQALKCTPSVRFNLIVYDCGDPWEILRAALNPASKETNDG